MVSITPDAEKFINDLLEKNQKVGYGIKKLQVMCNVVDCLVSVDEVEEKIAEFDDLVQSVDIFAFNKL